MSQSAYRRGQHPRSRQNLLKGHAETLQPANREQSGIWGWVRDRRLPDRPWVPDVLEEVGRLVSDEIARCGGEDQLEPIDRADLDVLHVAAVAQRLAVRQWQSDGLPMSRKHGAPGYLRRDWAKFASLERSALRHLRERHVSRRDEPLTFAEIVRGE